MHNNEILTFVPIININTTAIACRWIATHSETLLAGAAIFKDTKESDLFAGVFV